MYDFICGLCYLDYYLEDGGHTSMSYATKDKLNQYYGEFPLSEFSELELTEEGSDRVKYIVNDRINTILNNQNTRISGG